LEDEQNLFDAVIGERQDTIIAHAADSDHAALGLNSDCDVVDEVDLDAEQISKIEHTTFWRPSN
jgi:hypothetical protein